MPVPFVLRLVPRALVAGATLALLGGCAEGMGGPPLVSAQFPPAASGSVGAQPAGSLPRGAANVGPGPNATQNSFLSWTFGTRR